MKGINALAGRVGTPLVMDNISASMCKQGIEMVRYAMVLIEVSAKKELAENIEIMNEPSKIASTGYKMENVNVHKENNGGHVSKEVNDGFVEVKNRKNIGIVNKVKR
nr:zinc knuckle CX2CX4HX4C [Tanacetum cinerariifolium]